MGKPLQGSNEKTPPISNPVWAKWSDPLLKFLQEGPRTWPQLEKWCASHGVSGFRLRNCLAWLEDAGLARSEGSDKNVKWVDGRK